MFTPLHSTFGTHSTILFFSFYIFGFCSPNYSIYILILERKPSVIFFLRFNFCLIVLQYSTVQSGSSGSVSSFFPSRFLLKSTVSIINVFYVKSKSKNLTYLLSVPKVTANLYCICLSMDLLYS